MIGIFWTWGEAFLRWLHVIAGIAWIGASFYFIHLDLSLKRREDLPPEAYGEAWQVHGGGFYNMVKYLVAPTRMPAELTWFKWEAYATWSPPASPWWWRSTTPTPGSNSSPPRCSTLLTALAWLSTRLFSPRGAFMQMGALIGTIMAVNVLMVIIPGQRKVVADLIAGRRPDAIHGWRGKQRSTHNNYLTLPVVFVMLSGRYPLAYATRWSWVILALPLVMGGVIRHFFNVRHQGKPSPWWTWSAAALCALAIVWLSTLGPAGAVASAGSAKRADAGAAAPVTFQQVEEIVIGRCSMCHAADPAWEGIIRPPRGVMLDTPERIKAHAREIALAAVWSSAMPPSNVTSMTPEERATLAAWLASGHASN